MWEQITKHILIWEQISKKKTINIKKYECNQTRW